MAAMKPNITHKVHKSANGNIVVDSGVQVSESFMLTQSQNKTQDHGLHLGQNSATRDARACFPNLFEIPPEEIRGAILSQGENYWKSSIQIGRVLAVTSIFQLVVYFIVFGTTGHYSNVLALLPIRDTVTVWFLVMTGCDILIIIIVRIGKMLSKKYHFGKKIDMWFILLATMILFANVVSSIFYPIYTTRHLIVISPGTVENNGNCMEAQGSFAQAETSNSIEALREICENHILCVENCRDFRQMFFWLYGTYLMTIVRLFMLSTIWNVYRYLYIIMNVDDEDVQSPTLGRF